MSQGLTGGSRVGADGFKVAGQPGVQPVPDFIRSVGATAPLIADDHRPGRGHARESGQSQHFVPAHLLRLDRVRREYQPHSRCLLWVVNWGSKLFRIS